MRYFHRTSLAPTDVLTEADAFFAGRLAPVESTSRGRVFNGTIGEVRVTAAAEGGHYTLVTVSTDRVGESEVDKLAKRYLALVHAQVDRSHVVRGAY